MGCLNLPRTPHKICCLAKGRTFDVRVELTFDSNSKLIPSIDPHWNNSLRISTFDATVLFICIVPLDQHVTCKPIQGFLHKHWLLCPSLLSYILFYFILTELENNITHLMAGFGVIKACLQREQDLLLTHLNAVKKFLIIKQNSRK